MGIWLYLVGFDWVVESSSVCRLAYSSRFVMYCFFGFFYTVSQKNCAFLFLSELRQISTNFNKFWSVDGKVAEIVRYIYTVHLT